MMKLMLEELHVESFFLEPETAWNRGTVKGQGVEATAASNCFTHCATEEPTCTCPSQERTYCLGDSCTMCHPEPETWWWEWTCYEGPIEA